MEKCSRRLW